MFEIDTSDACFDVLLDCGFLLLWFFSGFGFGALLRYVCLLIYLVLLLLVFANLMLGLFVFVIACIELMFTLVGLYVYGYFGYGLTWLFCGIVGYFGGCLLFVVFDYVLLLGLFWAVGLVVLVGLLWVCRFNYVVGW